MIEVTDAKINRLGIVRTVAIGLRQVGLLAFFTEEIEVALIIPEELERPTRLDEITIGHSGSVLHNRR